MTPPVMPAALIAILQLFLAIPGSAQAPTVAAPAEPVARPLPVRIQPYVQIAGFALIVRQHLRLADPNHWPILRWFVGLAALGIALVPLLQLYITEERLTRVQTVTHLGHPMLRTARPATIEAFLADSVALKRKVDDSRDRNLAERGLFEIQED